MTNAYTSYIEANFFFKQKDFISALNCINEAITQNSQINYFYYKRYFICKELDKMSPYHNQYVEIYKDISTFLKLTNFSNLTDDDMGAVYFYYARAVLFSDQKDFKSALESIDEAINLEPSVKHLYDTRDIVYNKMDLGMNYVAISKNNGSNYKKILENIAHKPQLDLNTFNFFTLEFNHLCQTNPQSILIECENKFIEWFHQGNNLLAGLWLEKIDNLTTLKMLKLRDIHSLMLIKSYQRDFCKRDQNFEQAFAHHIEVEVLGYSCYAPLQTSMSPEFTTPQSPPSDTSESKSEKHNNKSQLINGSLFSHWKNKYLRVSTSGIISFVELLPLKLWEHQKETLIAMTQTLEKAKTNETPPWVVEIATGGGKTRVQIALTYHLIQENPDGVVYIVTPTLQLSEQFYQDFITFIKQFDSPLIDKEDIIIVSSKAINQTSFKKNKEFQTKTKVVIFCQQSFLNHMLSQTPETISFYKSPLLLLLDEYHLYKKRTNELVKMGFSIMAFSATPSDDDRCYLVNQVSRTDLLKAGIIVPLIIDRVAMRLNMKKDLKKYQAFDTQKIINQLFNFRHPQGQILCENKGIIFVQSILHATNLKEMLDSIKPNYAQIVHSKVKKYRDVIAEYRQKKWNTSALLIAVEMVMTGYDDIDVMWVIIAKETDSANIAQIIGRTLRSGSLGKEIALVLVSHDFHHIGFEQRRDPEAIEKSKSDYFSTNVEIIMTDLYRVVKEKEPFEYHQRLFTADKLNGVSLRYHLILLLIALKENNEQWVKQLLGYDKLLWSNEELTNIINQFMHQISQPLLIDGMNEEAALFSTWQFQQLLEKIRYYQPKLLKILSEINLSLFTRYRVDYSYQTIWKTYQSKLNDPEQSTSTFFNPKKRKVDYNESCQENIIEPCRLEF